MRAQLKDHLDEKVTVVANFEHYGLKHNYIGGDSITMLLNKLQIKGIEIDHCWITVGKTLETANIPEGSKIKFNAWIKAYWKGYINHRDEQYWKERDIGINRVSNVSTMSKGSGRDFVAFFKECRDKHTFISNKYRQQLLKQ